MLNFLFGLLSYDLAIDLGTANTLVYVSGKGIAVREPSIVARNKKSKQILAIGKEALKMYGKTGSTIEVFRPLRNGVISDYQGASALLSHYIRKVHETNKFYTRIPRPLVVIGIPGSITEVERKSVVEVAKAAGARKVYLVPEAVASAVGANAKILQGPAHGVVDIGGGTTDIAFIVGGKVAVGESIKIAGDLFDETLIDYVKLKYSLLIGQPTSEKLKIALADAIPVREHFYVVRGRDLETGFPKSVRVSSFEVHEALGPLYEKLIQEIVRLLQESPPELVSDLMSTGIVVTGGGALIRNIASAIEEKTEITTKIADDPLTAVVRGAGKLLRDRDLLNAVKY